MSCPQEEQEQQQRDPGEQKLIGYRSEIGATPPESLPPSDIMTIGFEQIIVCATLLIITLIFLSTASHRRRMKERLYAWICKFKRSKNTVIIEEGKLKIQRNSKQAKEQEYKNRTTKRCYSVDDIHRYNSSSSQKESVLTNGISICKGDLPPPNEFETLWPHIRFSPYRKLVLPPSCKRVCKSKHKHTKKHAKKQKAQKPMIWNFLQGIDWKYWLSSFFFFGGFCGAVLHRCLVMFSYLAMRVRRRRVLKDGENGEEEGLQQVHEEEDDNSTIISAKEEEEKKDERILSGWELESLPKSNLHPSQHPHVNTIFPSVRPLLRKSSSQHYDQPDKNGFILGDTHLEEFKINNATPLLVFINSRSGGQQGNLLIHQLKRLLNPVQLWDLDSDGDPTTALRSFCVFSRLRILVCGGDGTVSWIISCLESLHLEKWPPIAILPLGTGNDLARVHGWGGGYNNESLLYILQQVSEAYVSLLDLWELSISYDDVPRNKTIQKKKQKKKLPEMKSFINYLGVGVDAQAALQFHQMRESKPKLFFSRFVNKLWYAIFGADHALKASCAGLSDEIVLVADGVEIPLPEDSQGVIFLNIDSYTGGVPLWGHGAKEGWYRGGRRGRGRKTSDEHFLGVGDLCGWDDGYGLTYPMPSIHRHGIFERIDSYEDLDNCYQPYPKEQTFQKVTACNLPSSCQDGMLDVVSIRGTFHLGQIRVGLSNAQLICQCRQASVLLKRNVAVQIDGEPWEQSSPCTLNISRKKDSAIMLHRTEEGKLGGSVVTEVANLLDWAEERNIIDRKVHYTLMKEFSRRIENQTRERRVRSQDNLMLSLKRALANNPSM